MNEFAKKLAEIKSAILENNGQSNVFLTNQTQLSWTYIKFDGTIHTAVLYAYDHPNSKPWRVLIDGQTNLHLFDHELKSFISSHRPTRGVDKASNMFNDLFAPEVKRVQVVGSGKLKDKPCMGCQVCTTNHPVVPKVSVENLPPQIQTEQPEESFNAAKVILEWINLAKFTDVLKNNTLIFNDGCLVWENDNGNAVYLNTRYNKENKWEFVIGPNVFTYSDRKLKTALIDNHPPLVSRIAIDMAACLVPEFIYKVTHERLLDALKYYLAPCPTDFVTSNSVAEDIAEKLCYINIFRVAAGIKTDISEYTLSNIISKSR